MYRQISINGRYFFSGQLFFSFEEFYEALGEDIQAVISIEDLKQKGNLAFANIPILSGSGLSFKRAPFDRNAVLIE